MSLRIVTSNSIVDGGDAMILSPQESLFVAAGVTLAARTSSIYSGVVASYIGHLITIAGFVAGRAGITTLGQSADITILAGGGVFGEVTGIQIEGTSDRVTNAGTITGDTGIYAIGFLNLINTGLISGDNGIVAENGGNVINQGTISGRYALNVSGSQRYYFENHGFSSAISMGDGADDVMNFGVISGNVAMGAGSDLVDTSGGQIRGRIYLGTGDDICIGGDFADVIDGQDQNDDLDGGAGNDRFVSYNGDGNDTIEGGAGIDLYDARASSLAMKISLVTGLARSSGQTDLLSGIERVFGGSASDSIEGDAGSNLLWGEAGNDTLAGNAGNDKLVGGLGLDTLYGGDGNDRLEGVDGRDRLLGGLGDDVIIGSYDIDIMTGDSGADRFEFNDFDEFLPTTGTGIDRISDFAVGVDKIDFYSIDTSLAAGDQAFTFVGTAGITGLGQIGYRVSGSNTYVTMGLYAATAQDILRLDGILVLTAADFIL